MKNFSLFILLISLVNNAFAQRMNKEIEGDWTCFSTGCKWVCETCCRDQIYFDLRIHNDSVDVFDYPYTYFGSYKIDSFAKNFNLDILSYESRKAPLFQQLEVSNDTLTTDTNYSFYRDTFENQIISSLIKDSINLKNLLGKWEIVLEYPEDYGMGPFHVKLPFKITDKLNFKSESQLPTTRFFQLRVDGELKPFYIESLTSYRLTVITGSWYNNNKVNSARGHYYPNPPGKFIIDYRKVVD